MDTFPLLKTGAVLQFPASRTTEFATGVVQFMDGSEQRYRDYGRAYRRWTIALAALDESEIQNIRTFIAEMNGASGIFSFTDPWDGTVYPACSMENEALDDVASGPMESGTSLVIRENVI